MTGFIAGVAPKNKMDDNGYETHDEIASPPTNPHDDAADDTKKDAYLSDLIAAIGWHFIVMI